MSKEIRHETRVESKLFAAYENLCAIEKRSARKQTAFLIEQFVNQKESILDKKAKK